MLNISISFLCTQVVTSSVWSKKNTKYSTYSWIAYWMQLNCTSSNVLILKVSSSTKLCLRFKNVGNFKKLLQALILARLCAETNNKISVALINLIYDVMVKNSMGKMFIQKWIIRQIFLKKQNWCQRNVKSFFTCALNKLSSKFNLVLISRFSNICLTGERLGIKEKLISQLF